MNVSHVRWIVVAVTLAAVTGCRDRVNTREVSVNSDRIDEIRRGFVGTEVAKEDGSDATQVPQPTGWGTLKGTFQINGSAPVMPMVSVDKDIEVCKVVPDAAVVVGPNGGIKNIVIYLTSKIPDEEPWTHPSAKSGKTEPVEFDQKECVFLSHVLAMQCSQPLIIKNSDTVGHNTNMAPKSNSGFNQIIPAGGQLTYQPSVEESQPFSVTCSIHKWMAANMIFRKNSYFAVTDENGAFEIPNLPSGVELEFRVWQERTKFLQEVTLDGKALRWSKGKYLLPPLQPDEQKQIQVAVDASAFSG